MTSDICAISSEVGAAPSAAPLLYGHWRRVLFCRRQLWNLNPDSPVPFRSSAIKHLHLPYFISPYKLCAGCVWKTAMSETAVSEKQPDNKFKSTRILFCGPSHLIFAFSSIMLCFFFLFTVHSAFSLPVACSKTLHCFWFPAQFQHLFFSVLSTVDLL